MYFTIKAETPVDKQGRNIPYDVLKNSVEEYKERCAGKAYGFIQTSEDFVNYFSNVTHTIEDVELSLSGEITALILPTNTPNGKLLEKVITSEDIIPNFYVNGEIEYGETDENGNTTVKNMFINSIDWL